MDYLDQLRKDVLSEDDNPVAEEVEDRILFQRYRAATKEERIPLKDVIKNIGTEEDIKTIINHFKKWTELNSRLFVHVMCNLPQRLIDSEKSRQKTLDFIIRDVTTGNIVLNGGILFQDGKISFHT